MGLYKKIIKPSFDITAALFGLLIASPIVITLIIILIVVNNGKPFFFQNRAGKNGKLFKIIKFKTMTDKTDINGELLPALKRVTKIGDFCRKFSLDEIPQLINIVKGDMSLVGPRPLLPEYLEYYSPEQNRRHDVQTGITGWAQVNGRNAISWEQKFKYDVFYVDNQSFLLDMRIMIKTIGKVINRNDINNSEQVDMPRFGGTRKDV